MWGIIPAAGSGTRIQPLAFSKELLPVGSRLDATGIERPRAVSEYLVDRMVQAGAERICFVISPWKSDILQYYGGRYGATDIAYTIQAGAHGLCDAIFTALPVVHRDDPVIVGLPDTIWYPADALRLLPDDRLSFLLFPVERPELFDSVECDGDGRVRRIAVKDCGARSRWIWGAFKMPGAVFHALYDLWVARDRRDAFVGTLVNAWLEAGNAAWAVRGGESYVDVGTLHGYREAIRLLGAAAAPDTAAALEPMARPTASRLEGVAR